MEYGEITAGRFLDRPNRFIAHVETGGTLRPPTGCSGSSPPPAAFSRT